MRTEKDLNDFYKENKALLKEYIELRMELFRMHAVRMISKSISMMAVIFFTGILFLFVLLFMGVSFSLWLSDRSGSMVMGFMGGAGLFLILLILTILFRKPLFLNPLIRLFINETVSDVDENEQES
ncbi:MAG: hypothetical protein ACO29O_02040 [Chitinophagaceae bacterium]